MYLSLCTPPPIYHLALLRWSTGKYALRLAFVESAGILIDYYGERFSALLPSILPAVWTALALSHTPSPALSASADSGLPSVPLEDWRIVYCALKAMEGLLSAVSLGELERHLSPSLLHPHCRSLLWPGSDGADGDTQQQLPSVSAIMSGSARVGVAQALAGLWCCAMTSGLGHPHPWIAALALRILATYYGKKSPAALTKQQQQGSRKGKKAASSPAPPLLYVALPDDRDYPPPSVLLHRLVSLMASPRAEDQPQLCDALLAALTGACGLALSCPDMMGVEEGATDDEQHQQEDEASAEDAPPEGEGIMDMDAAADRERKRSFDQLNGHAERGGEHGEAVKRPRTADNKGPDEGDAAKEDRETDAAVIPPELITGSLLHQIHLSPHESRRQPPPFPRSSDQPAPPPSPSPSPLSPARQLQRSQVLWCVRRLSGRTSRYLGATPTHPVRTALLIQFYRQLPTILPPDLLVQHGLLDACVRSLHQIASSAVRARDRVEEDIGHLLTRVTDQDRGMVWGGVRELSTGQQVAVLAHMAGQALERLDRHISGGGLSAEYTQALTAARQVRICLHKRLVAHWMDGWTCLCVWVHAGCWFPAPSTSCGGAAEGGRCATAGRTKESPQTDQEEDEETEGPAEYQMTASVGRSMSGFGVSVVHVRCVL